MRANIGPGRFGPIYRAAGSDGGDVAIKVFDQGLTPEQARLLAEALDLLSRQPLDHPSIVAAVGAGVQGDLAWVAEPWIDATPLDTVLANVGALPVAESLLRITQVAGALDFAAAAGVFHGALHPHDVLLSADRALVTGLGFVQALSEAGFDVPLSGASSSPQRALGLPVTHADDIYTLAAITIEMFYGRPLSDRRRVRSVVTPLSGIDHARLLDVLEGSLAEDPGDRPSTALEFAGALQRALAPVPAPIADSDSTVPAADAQLPSEGRPGVDAYSDFDAAPHVPAPLPIDAGGPAIDLPLRAAAISAAPVAPDESPWEPVAEIASLEPPLASQQSEPRVVAERSSPEYETGTRHDFVAPERELESASRYPAFQLAGGHREAAPESEGVRASFFGVAVGLAIGILAGFAGGFVVGQRDATPTPMSASRAIPRAQRAPAPDAEAPAATSGREFTESAVPPATVAEPDVRPTERPDAPEIASSRADGRAQADVPGRVEVVSRPSGAQVFLDGRLVGRTPLTLSQVAVGPHAVRLALAGHQRWVTTVDVEPGEHARVAASLER